jgi:hypothetical protein
MYYDENPVDVSDLLKVALNIKIHKAQTFSFIYSKIATRLQMSGTQLLSCRREVHNLYIIIATIVLIVSQKWRYPWTGFIHVNLPAGAFFSQFWGSLPSLLSTFKIFCPWKKSSTIKSWPTFCDQVIKFVSDLRQVVVFYGFLHQ